MGWRRSHERPNRRPNKIIDKKLGRPNELFRTLGQLNNERGLASEERFGTMLKELVQEGLLLGAYESEEFSWANHVLKADVIAIRLDGKAVPIQVKSRFDGVRIFQEKWHDYCVCLYGQMPVWSTIPSGDLVGEARENKKQKILRLVNAWRGRLVFETWMSKSSPFFSHAQYKRSGFHGCVQAFRRTRPQYFA